MNTNPGPLECPVDGCDGRLEINLTMWLSLTLREDRRVQAEVYGFDRDSGIRVTCDDHEHVLFRAKHPELHQACVDAVLSLATAIENNPRMAPTGVSDKIPN